ncbi:hypothetical protein D9M71_820810 [compost metagenome]
MPTFRLPAPVKAKAWAALPATMWEVLAGLLSRTLPLREMASSCAEVSVPASFWLIWPSAANVRVPLAELTGALILSEPALSSVAVPPVAVTA